MQGISHRLAAPSKRAMWLGMVVAMALSEVVDKADNRVIFDIEDMQSPEAKWYRQLIHVDDKLDDLNYLRGLLQPQPAPVPTSLTKGTPKSEKAMKGHEAKSAIGPVQTQTPIPDGLRIVELSDSSEDDEFQPYAKPDSDSEDSDEDPTLVQRNKPRAPV
jgi:telomere length regulation protein